MAGIVVESKSSGIRFAISEENFREKLHTKIRDLKPHESVLSYKPSKKAPLQENVAVPGGAAASATGKTPGK